MWEFLQKLKELQPESKNIVLTGLTGEALGEKALVSIGKLVWASVAGGFLERHDQQIEQLEVNGIVLVDGEKIFGEVIGGQKKIVICGGGHVAMPIIQLGRQIGNAVRPAVFVMQQVNDLLHRKTGADDLRLDFVAYIHIQILP